VNILSKVWLHRHALLHLQSYRLALASKRDQAEWFSDEQLHALAVPSRPVRTDVLEEQPDLKEDGRIPRLIFQTWKSKTDIPVNYLYWRRTVESHHPDWTLLLWDDFDNRQFIETEFGWLLKAYDLYPREIFRADIVRILFMLRHGGFYLDMDVECLKPLDKYLLVKGLILGRMGWDNDFAHSVPNAMLASAPNHFFWVVALTLALERQAALSQLEMAESGPERLTGPVLIRDAFILYNSLDTQGLRMRCSAVLEQLPQHVDIVKTRIEVLPALEWYPIDWNNPLHQFFRKRMIRDKIVPGRAFANSLFPEATLATYWTHSW